MSFFSDLFHGNWGNLGEDIAPQNIFKDTVSSFAGQPGWAQALELALPAIVTGGLALAPEFAGAAAEGGLAAADIGAGAADWTAAGLDVGGTLGPGVAGATGAVDIGTPIVTGAGEALPAAAEPTALTSAFDIPGGVSAVPFTDVAGGLTGGGGTDLTGTIGGLEFSPSTEIATGGNVIPNVATAGGAGGAGGGSPFVGVSDTALDPYAAGSAYTPGAPTNIAPSATGGGAAAPADTSFMGNLKSSFNAFPGQLGKALGNPLTDLGIAGLGYNLFQGYQQNQALKAEQAAVKQQADAVAAGGRASLAAAQPDLAIGEALMTGGPVPGPMQAMLDQVRNAERARIIQGYAARNPTDPGAADPKMNSALAQDLNNLDTNLAAFREQIGQQIVTTANQLLSSGASAVQISENMAIAMQKLDMQLQQMTGNAIANFASAMSGGTMKFAGQGSGQNLNINLTGGTGSVGA